MHPQLIAIFLALLYSTIEIRPGFSYDEPVTIPMLAGIDLHTWGSRRAIVVKCLAQGRTRTYDSEIMSPEL